MSAIECDIDDGNLYGEFGGVVSNSCISTVSFGVATLNPDLLAALDGNVVHCKRFKSDNGGKEMFILMGFINDNGIVGINIFLLRIHLIWMINKLHSSNLIHSTHFKKHFAYF